MARSGLTLFVLSGALWPVAALPNSEAVPDFSGGWARIGALVETYEAIPGYAGAGPMLVDPLHPHIEGGTGEQVEWVPAIDNLILSPETKARLKIIRDAELEGIPHLKDEGVCQPSGVPMLLNRRGAAVQILQAPDRVLILNARDSQARTIYLNVPHSKTVKRSWYGESVGHYEGGDTLVVDTIGENDKTQVDRFGTPHSDKIRVVERYRIAPDHKTIEVQFTVDDPGAFTVPWSARVRFAASRQPWDEEVCAENNRFVGKVTVAGKITTDVRIPIASAPDF
jgi:hypothetical protein